MCSPSAHQPRPYCLSLLHERKQRGVPLVGAPLRSTSRRPPVPLRRCALPASSVGANTSETARRAVRTITRADAARAGVTLRSCDHVDPAEFTPIAARTKSIGPRRPTTRPNRRQCDKDAAALRRAEPPDVDVRARRFARVVKEVVEVRVRVRTEHVDIDRLTDSAAGAARPAPATPRWRRPATCSDRDSIRWRARSCRAASRSARSAQQPFGQPASQLRDDATQRRARNRMRTWPKRPRPGGP